MTDISSYYHNLKLGPVGMVEVGGGGGGGGNPVMELYPVGELNFG